MTNLNPDKSQPRGDDKAIGRYLTALMHEQAMTGAKFISQKQLAYGLDALREGVGGTITLELPTKAGQFVEVIYRGPGR